MRRLYHGTRYLRAILAEQTIRCAKSGDMHVSLTSKKAEARYWASVIRDDVEGSGYILTLDGDRLRGDGFTLLPYQSPAASRDEHEIACLEDIDNVLRYIVTIEKVPGTEMTLEDAANWWRAALARGPRRKKGRAGAAFNLGSVGLRLPQPKPLDMPKGRHAGGGESACSSQVRTRAR